jgi:predicted nucleotide-binding protein (sugar kinase/HSP70/actin superfamily)
MKAVTIRGVNADVAEKLKAYAKAQGKSTNQLILDIIKAGVGLKKVKKYSREYDDLDDLFGRWSENEFNEISARINKERKIDPELWR